MVAEVTDRMDYRRMNRKRRMGNRTGKVEKAEDSENVKRWTQGTLLPPDTCPRGL